MGVSTDGILFYGIDLGEEVDLCVSEDWEEYYASKMGWVEDSGLFDEAGGYAILNNPEEKKAAEERWKINWAKKHAILEACPVEIGRHCSCDYPMYYIAIKQTVITARRGSSEAVPIEKLKIGYTWDQELINFMKFMGIESNAIYGEWTLVSYWG